MALFNVVSQDIGSLSFRVMRQALPHPHFKWIEVVLPVSTSSTRHFKKGEMKQLCAAAHRNSKLAAS